jgi:hypothetical protein
MRLRTSNALVLVGLSSIIVVAVSIAFSASKSAGAPPQLTNTQTTSQAPTPVATSSEQERVPCSLKTSEAPVINRLKLGLSLNEILAAFPGSKEDPEVRSALSAPHGPFGNFTFLITPSKYGSTADFKDVSRVTFTMLDEHLSSFTISYNGPQWPDVDKFVEKFVADKDLPPVEQWDKYVGMETQMKTLTCNGFSVQIFAGGEGGNLNYVLVQDLDANKKLKERRKKAREEASQTPAQ